MPLKFLKINFKNEGENEGEYCSDVIEHTICHI